MFDSVLVEKKKLDGHSSLSLPTLFFSLPPTLKFQSPLSLYLQLFLSLPLSPSLPLTPSLLPSPLSQCISLSLTVFCQFTYYFSTIIEIVGYFEIANFPITIMIEYTGADLRGVCKHPQNYPGLTLSLSLYEGILISRVIVSTPLES